MRCSFTQYDQRVDKTDTITATFFLQLSFCIKILFSLLRFTLNLKKYLSQSHMATHMYINLQNREKKQAKQSWRAFVANSLQYSEMKYIPRIDDILMQLSAILNRQLY